MSDAHQSYRCSRTSNVCTTDGGGGVGATAAGAAEGAGRICLIGRHIKPDASRFVPKTASPHDSYSDASHRAVHVGLSMRVG